ncbi:MAG: hypothetical protein AAGF83_25100 [Cyanobacteria bacterium P01_G01_bin.67]
MNLTPRRLFGFFSIFICALVLIIVALPASGTAVNLTVDVAEITADVSNQPLGIGLNFIGDRPNISEPLGKIKAGTLRFATSEYYLFDPSEPNKPKVSIQDPKLWQVDSFAKPDGTWWDKLSFDDFMALCHSTNAEPFIVVGIDAIAYTGNAPHASPEEVLASAVAWVKYANLVKGYQIKYWEIGNESNLNQSALVHWTPEKYAQTVVQFSRAMKAVDPTIKIGANGMRIRKNEDWWGQVMPIINDDVDYLVTHQYSWLESYQEWRDSEFGYDYNLKDAIEAINSFNPNLRLNVTENSAANLGFTHSNNTWKMLHNFEMQGGTLSFNQVDYVHFWTSRWLEADPYAADNSAFDDNYQLTPMGYSLKVWNTFLKQKLVFSTKAVGTVRSWASYDPEDDSLNIFVLNKDQARQKASISLNNYTPKSRNERWLLRGATPQSQDIVWRKFGSAPVRGAKVQTKLEPLSVTVISFSGNK